MISCNRRGGILLWYLAVAQQLIPLLSSEGFLPFGLGVDGVQPDVVVGEVAHNLGHMVCLIEA